jgi:hypothetical protein
MTQAECVLRELRARRHGVHTFELRNMYVANPSQRIAELEQRGHVIRHERERLHGQAFGTRYTLLYDADTKRAA